MKIFYLFFQHSFFSYRQRLLKLSRRPQTALPIISLLGALSVFFTANLSLSQDSINTNRNAPALWADHDLGKVMLTGISQISDSIYEVRASGGDLLGTEDAFHFVHQSWQGDGVIIARVLSIAGPNGSGKAGLMIRSSLNADAANVVFALSGINRFTFQRRSEPGEASERDAFTTVPLPNGAQQVAKAGRSRLWINDENEPIVKHSAPYWLMVVRRGNEFSGFSSADGTNWQWFTTERVTMPSRVEIGLAVTSFDERVLCVAKFDQVSVQPLTTKIVTALPGSGEGLLGTFKDRIGMNKIQRISPTISFDWSHPTRRLPGVETKNLSATWEGYVEAQYSEPYALQVVHNDCVRLWIEEKLAIDDCQKTGLGQAKAVVLFEARRKYSIRLEYLSEKASGSVKLMWSSPSIAKQVIPKTQLYATDGAGVLATNPSTVDLSSGISALQATDQSPELSLPWLNRALGSMTNAENAWNSGTSFLTVGGHGIAGRAVDEGRFVYQPAEGDVEVSARIVSLQEKSPSARVGLMMRENLKEESPTVFLEIDPKNRARIFYRKGVEHGRFLGPYGLGAPWIKLVRRGDTFTAFKSTNGIRWFWLGSVSVPISTNAFIGLVVGSNDPHNPYQASFNDVQVRVPATNSALVGTGDGLGATYTDQTSSNRLQRIDSQINFTWGRRPPIEGVSLTNFTVQWEGLIEAQSSEIYRIYIPSDQRIKLWLDGKQIFKGERGPASAERRATIPMRAGRLYAFRMTYEHSVGASQVRLLWSSPQTAKQPVPQSQLYSPQSVAFNEIADKDHDGIRDNWEVAHGLDPYDASDALGDSDGDGLTNLKEFLAGTDPHNSDTDGDGLSDGVEVNEMGSNPLYGDILKVENVFDVAGAKLVGQLGGWAVEGQTVYSLDGRGWIEYLLTVPKDDMYRLEIEGGSHNPNDPGKQFDLLVSLDREYLGRSFLVTGPTNNGAVHTLTPWIRAGEHRLRIYWDNGSWYRSLKLSAVRVQCLEGIDLNTNGISDWVEGRLRVLSRVEVIPAFSAVSPACVEGRDRYLSMMNISGGTVPQPGVSNRWYANVSLDEKGPTRIICSFQNEGMTTTNQIIWRPTNLLQADDQVLRTGDALLLTALPADALKGDAQNGVVQITVVGVTNYTSDNGQPVAHQFSQAGRFSIVGSYLSQTGQTQTRTVSVKVVSAPFAEKPAVWVGKSRKWRVALPEGLVLETDPRLKLKAVETTDLRTRQYTMTVDDAEKRYALARIGTNGPVVANIPAEGFRIFSAYETGIFRTAAYDDGSELVKMDLIMSPLLPQIRIQIELLAGGVIFEDGTLVKNLTAVDFDELGRATVRFIRPPTFKTSICHRIHLYQGDLLMGSYP